MATIKSYTDLEQSLKLAEILPLESADICYPLPCEDGDKPLLEQGGFGSTPCWSLAALLSVLPNPSLHQTKDGDWYCDAEPNRLYFSSHHSTPIDACAEMVLKLHKLKML